MGSQQVFCLRWSNHQSNMLSVFDELLQTETLVDVTIACEGLSMKAHKVVLSACSPYFQTLFLQNPCKHPIVILKDIKYSELKALIDFMYKGEVNVTQEQLSTLLKTAETLKIKGLAEVTGGVNGQQTDDSDNFSPASFERKVFHNIARSMNPASDSRSSTPPHPPPPPPPPPLPASAPLPLLSSQLSSTMPSHSPPTKRKKMRPKRRSPEANHSNNNEEGESVKVQGSPEMLETKVEVASDEFDHVPSRTSDHDEQMDQPSDLQTDSNQESLDNPFPSQGQANPSNEEFSAGGEPMPATSPSFTPLSLLQKLKSPGPSTSSGMSSQGDAYYLGVRLDYSGYIPKRGQPRILNEDEEEMIVSYIMDMAAIGRPVTRRCVLEYGNTLLRREGRIPTGSIHCNPEKGLSNDWWKEFKKRHPGLPVRNPSSTPVPGQPQFQSGWEQFQSPSDSGHSQPLSSWDTTASQGPGGPVQPQGGDPHTGALQDGGQTPSHDGGALVQPGAGGQGGEGPSYSVAGPAHTHDSGNRPPLSQGDKDHLRLQDDDDDDDQLQPPQSVGGHLQSGGGIS